MKNEKDLRVIRTKRAIKKAFLQLMERKSIEQITIKDISEEAMINRSTFYLHYQDKYELLKSISDELIEGFDRVSSEITMEECLHAKENNTYFESLIPILTYIKENSAAFSLISTSQDSMSFYERIGSIIMNKQRRVNEDTFKGLDFRYANSASTAVFCSIIRTWIINGMIDSKEKVARNLTAIALRMV